MRVVDDDRNTDADETGVVGREAFRTFLTAGRLLSAPPRTVQAIGGGG